MFYKGHCTADVSLKQQNRCKMKNSLLTAKWFIIVPPGDLGLLLDMSIYEPRSNGNYILLLTVCGRYENT